MFIGQISELTGASIKAIRHYEALGLLNKVGRSGKYRTYHRQHIALVRLILKAKSLGFRLSEIKRVVEQTDSRSPWESILLMIAEKQQQIDETIEALQTQKQALANYHNIIVDCLNESPDCALDEAALDSATKGRL